MKILAIIANLSWLRPGTRVRNLMIFIGILAGAGLIWTLGPLVQIFGSEPLVKPAHRWLIIIILFSSLGAIFLIRAWWAWWRNSQLIDQLGTATISLADAPDPEIMHECQQLRAKFIQAQATLRRLEGWRRFGGKWLRQLPWYLIIGPSGVGKTTILRNSGLNFPLADQLGLDAVAGIGGTRTCDWWFTENAVLIDTAGRYTTQDSELRLDQAEWRDLLVLLAEYRPQRLIDAVLVAVSLADLLNQIPTERATQARALRHRIQDLGQRFGPGLPVYLICTKTDLIAGFNEFFADLDSTERMQVWGMTFLLKNHEAQDPLASFSDELNKLFERLEQRLLIRLIEERDLNKRALIFNFPRQFAALGEILESFLTAIFAPYRHRIHPRLRGVYFTSGTQVGTPIDRILKAFASRFDLNRPGVLPFQGTGKSFFVTQLLRELIIQETTLLNQNSGQFKYQLLIKRLAYGGLTALVLLPSIVWTLSFFNNQNQIKTIKLSIQELTARLNTLQTADSDPRVWLPVLNNARLLVENNELASHQSFFATHFWFKQGEKLKPQAQRTYRHLLEHAFWPLIMMQLEQRLIINQNNLQENPHAWSEIYDALRVYLMLGSTAHYDSTIVRRWIERAWRENLPPDTTPTQWQALRIHLTALCEWWPMPLPQALDENLIAAARTFLAAAEPSEYLYERLIQPDLGPQVPDFRLDLVAGNAAAQVFSRSSGAPITQGIPGIYTAAGYQRIFLPTSARLIETMQQENWVIGTRANLLLNESARQHLLIALKVRYLREYLTVWQAFFDDITFVAAHDLWHAAEIARLLADPVQSPLRLFLSAAANQTVRAEIFKQDVILETQIINKFKWLSDFIQLNLTDQQSLLDTTLNTFDHLQRDLTTIANELAANREPPALHQASGLQAAQALLPQLPVTLRHWFEPLLQEGIALAAGGMHARLDAIWRTEILPTCRQVVENRYPFIREGTQEADLKKFIVLFAPDGLLALFVRDELKQLIDTRDTTWHWLDDSLDLSSTTLTILQNAHLIQQAYFTTESNQLFSEFNLYPQRSKFILELGNQIIDFRSNLTQSIRLRWPPSNGDHRVRLNFNDGRKINVLINEEGTWAWLRLLEQLGAQVTETNHKISVNFSLNGRSIQFALTSLNQQTPFAIKELRAFHCLEHL